MSPRKVQVRKKTTKAESAAGSTPDGGLAAIVGDDFYRVWVAMLGELARNGRTHRLAVVVAGMLQYAAGVASEARKRRLVKLARVDPQLLGALEEPEPGGEDSELVVAVVRLFGDAGVACVRVNRRGDEYSIVDGAIDEFVRWFDLQWE